MTAKEGLERLLDSNAQYAKNGEALGDFSQKLREETYNNGQKPYAVVICCSDSRVVPEAIFGAGIGELFVIRVAGNILDCTQLGSVEYAVGHLGCKTVLVLGHDRCGAVGAALSGESHGQIKYITDRILTAAGGERNPDAVCRRNVEFACRQIDALFAENGYDDAACFGAIYRLESGRVELV